MRSTATIERNAGWGARRSAVASCEAGATAPDHAGEDGIELVIDAEKLYRLLVCNAVSVADFRCLGHTSKCRVRALCLRACARCLRQTDDNCGN